MRENSRVVCSTEGAMMTVKLPALNGYISFRFTASFTDVDYTVVS